MDTYLAMSELMLHNIVVRSAENCAKEEHLEMSTEIHKLVLNLKVALSELDYAYDKTTDTIRKLQLAIDLWDKTKPNESLSAQFDSAAIVQKLKENSYHEPMDDMNGCDPVQVIRLKDAIRIVTNCIQNS